MAFLPQNCSNFYLVQPGIKQNLLKLHPPRRFSQKRKMAKVVALYITSKVTGSSTSPYAMQNFISQAFFYCRYDQNWSHRNLCRKDGDSPSSGFILIVFIC